MIAILRYTFLKNMRDGSLAAFILGPMIMVAAPILGMAVLNRGGLADALGFDPHSNPARSATALAPVALFVAALFAALAGFWGLRGEIVSRSMGSFLLAARPLKIQIATMLFGATAAFAGYIGTSASLLAIIRALPPHPLRMLADAAILCLLGAAAGSLVVIISSQPWAIVPLYVCGAVGMPWLIGSGGVMPELIAVTLTMICVAVSAFFLERRCVT